MTPGRWRQIESLYDKALELNARQRTAFLREACGGDEDLQRELEGLLRKGRRRQVFWKSLPYGKSQMSSLERRRRRGLAVRSETMSLYHWPAPGAWVKFIEHAIRS